VTRIKNVKNVFYIYVRRNRLKGDDNDEVLRKATCEQRQPLCLIHKKLNYHKPDVLSVITLNIGTK